VILKKAHIVLFLFIVNSLVAITSHIEFFGELHTGIWRAVITGATLPLLLVHIRTNDTTRLIFVLITYLFIVVLNNTNFLPSFSIYVGVVFSLLMYPVAFTYINSRTHYDILYYIIIILLLLFGIHFIAAQILQYGPSPYMTGGAYLGGGGVQQTYVIVYLILFLPFLLFARDKKPEKLHIIVFVLSIAPVFLIFRRGAVFALIAGFMVYVLMTPRRGRWMQFAIVTFILLIFLSPFYYQKLVNTIQHRPIDPAEFTEVGRTMELLTYIPEHLNNRGIVHNLFGSELYDYRTLAGVTRELHTDYATYMIGAGIIGFILYFSVILLIWLDFWKNISRVQDKFARREIRAVLAALTVAYVIISYSGQFYVISSLSAIMLFFAIINRYTIEFAAQSETENQEVRS